MPTTVTPPAPGSAVNTPSSGAVTDGRGDRSNWAGLAARKKERTRRELGQAAMRLFVDQGYDGTTIEEIAAAVEISPRTFYRYFPTKEHLVTSLARTSMTSFCTELAARPPGESPLESVRAAIVAAYGEYWSNVDHLRSLLRLLRETPALRARWLDEAHHQRRQVADVLAPRLGDKTGGLRSEIAAGAVILTWNTALERWAHSESRRSPTAAVLAALGTLASPLLIPE